MVSVCAYCRVSTDSRQGDQANSFENQQLYFNRELLKNPDYVLHRIYADRGITGTKLHRDEFDQMLKDAGFWIYGADAGGSTITQVKFPARTAIVMGSEGNGISRKNRAGE